MLTGSGFWALWGISRTFSAMKLWTPLRASTVPCIRQTRSVVPAMRGQTKVISDCNVVWVGTWEQIRGICYRAGQTSTFILRWFDNEKCSLTFHKETQLLSYSPLPQFTQSTEKQLKERTVLVERATMVVVGGIPLQWCNSFSAVTLSISLPCSSNRLNTHFLQAYFCAHIEDTTGIPLPWQRGRAVETGDATASPLYLLARFFKTLSLLCYPFCPALMNILTFSPDFLGWLNQWH